MTDHLLYREICRHPEDDTVRLAYADWLEEHGDTHNADLAEYIRLGAESERIRGGGCAVVLGLDCDGTKSEWCIRCRLVKRLAELEARYGDRWRKCVCPRCQGVPYPEYHEPAPEGLPPCRTCRGTGDLFVRQTPLGALEGTQRRWHEPRPATFARGFAESVECTLAEVLREVRVGYDVRTSRYAGHEPTPWALAVVTHTPVVGFRVTDRSPTDRTAVNGQWYWFRDNRNALGGWTVESHIPDAAFDEMMVASTPDTIGLPFTTADDARTALARALGRLVRRVAYNAAGSV